MSSRLIKVLGLCSGEAQKQELLECILTPQELEKVEERWDIFIMLYKGKTHREISGKLGAGIATVTRGARVIKYGHKSIHDLIKKYIKKHAH